MHKYLPIFLLVTLGASTKLLNHKLESHSAVNFKNTAEISGVLLNQIIYSILKDKFDTDNHNFDTYVNILKLLVERDTYLMVETGTSRYGKDSCHLDGCSTLVFGEFAYITGRKLISVDISSENCIRSLKALKPWHKNTEIVNIDSFDFLRNINEVIDFLYLDSSDFDPEFPEEAQKHQLRELQLAYKKLHENSIILLEGCKLPDGGKCKLSIKLLESLGWETVNPEDDSLIYLFGNSLL